MKRNIGINTSADRAKENILRFLAKADMNQPTRKSAIGYAAFPGYSFISLRVQRFFGGSPGMRDGRRRTYVRYASTSYSTGYESTGTSGG